ncbi:MAG TPA: ArsA family ATPase [Candidatus Hypogeohydataceae bacterium YC41]
MRIILFTGKGGVGKTSVTAATAIKCSDLGYKTIVMSTDPAHSLGDSFNMEIGDRPKHLKDNLFGLEIDVHEELRRNWGKIQAFIKKNLVAMAKFNDLVAEEFAVFPGMEELFSLLRLKGFHDKKEYDVALLDCSPTASTVRMLSFPDIAEWYMEKVFRIERKIMKMARPVLNPMIEFELPNDEVYGTIEMLYQNIDGVKEILCDDKISSMRLVMNPEKMVYKESQRAYSYLNLFGFPVDAVVVNRVFPPEAGDYLARWQEIQAKYLKEIEESFSPLPILRSSFREVEMVGIERLREMARELYVDRDPTEVFVVEPPVTMTQHNGSYCVSLHLSTAHEKDLQLSMYKQELIVRLGSYRRNILLPRAVADKKLVKAVFEGTRLNITFEGAKDM